MNATNWRLASRPLGFHSMPLSCLLEIGVWEEKKKRLLQEVAGLKQAQLQCKRSIHGWREYLQQLDARLAQQTANKENLERNNQHFQRQWQIHLEVRLSLSLFPRSYWTVNNVQLIVFKTNQGSVFKFNDESLYSSDCLVAKRQKVGACRARVRRRGVESAFDVHVTGPSLTF